jgi:hypothetical protein
MTLSVIKQGAGSMKALGMLIYVFQYLIALVVLLVVVWAIGLAVELWRRMKSASADKKREGPGTD